MTATARHDAGALHRRGLQLASFIIVWDVIEGIVAVTAGLLAGSIALVGFGIDSAIEVFAASVVVWQLRGGGNDRRRVALRLIAPTFFLLAAYVAYEAIGDLLTGTKADPSPLGLGLNVVALLVMVPVAIMQGRTGRALGNDVLSAEAHETWISNALSVSLLLGLGANALLGWWWADPIAALLIALVAVYSGWETWREAGEEERTA